MAASANATQRDKPGNISNPVQFSNRMNTPDVNLALATDNASVQMTIKVGSYLDNGSSSNKH
jgi:hypothetical protein